MASISSSAVSCASTIRNPSGDLIELATLTPGAVIGEMSLLGEATRSASCRASSDDTLLLFVDRDEALALIDGDPQARQALVLILSERARNMVCFIHDSSHLTALVAKGDYNGVQTLISSSGTQDPSLNPKPSCSRRSPPSAWRSTTSAPPRRPSRSLGPRVSRPCSQARPIYAAVCGASEFSGLQPAS